MQSELSILRDLLKSSFEKGAWHGPSTLEILEGLSAEHALLGFPGTHNILELVSHMTAWRKYVIKKIVGDSHYRVSDAENFRGDKSWQEAVSDLHDSQQDLQAAFLNFPLEKLHDPIPGNPEGVTFYTLFHSIIHHDIYHAGQISLIRKALVKQTI